MPGDGEPALRSEPLGKPVPDPSQRHQRSPEELGGKTPGHRGWLFFLFFLNSNSLPKMRAYDVITDHFYCYLE